MGEDSSEMTSNTGGKRCCGYQFMTPSYVEEEEFNEAASYSDVANALLENTSSHGLPTLYRAQGDTDTPSTAGFCSTRLSPWNLILNCFRSLQKLVNKRRLFVWKTFVLYMDIPVGRG